MEKGFVDFLIPVAERGGVENVLISTTQYLQSCGWKVRVIQLVWENTRWLPADIDFYALAHGLGTYDINEFIENYKNFLLKEGAPEMAFGVGWPYANYIIKQAAFLINKPIFTISWLHAPLRSYTSAGFGDMAALNFADVHFSISPEITNEISAYKDCHPIMSVYNPVDFSNLKEIPRTTLGNRKKLLYIGRLNSEKRLDVIIKALSISKTDWELHIIGSTDSEYTNEIIKLISDCNLDSQVIMHGWSDTPFNEVDSADALVIASEYEGFCLAAIEALQCGIPVISTPVGILPYLIVPGENGYLFPNNDSSSLAEVLDAIYNKILPEISPMNCRKGIEKYESENALSDFEDKLSRLYGIYKGN